MAFEYQAVKAGDVIEAGPWNHAMEEIARLGKELGQKIGDLESLRKELLELRERNGGGSPAGKGAPPAGKGASPEQPEQPVVKTIQEMIPFAHAGSTTTSTTLVPAHTPFVEFTPKSGSSKLLLEVSFYTTVGIVNTTNTTGGYAIFEAKGGSNVSVTGTHYVSALLRNHGCGVYACPLIRAVVPSAGTGKRSFFLAHCSNIAPGRGSNTIASRHIVFTIRELE